MPLYKIQKRNGAIVDFELGKIKDAIAKAAEVVGQLDPVVPETLVKEVEIELEEKYSDQIPTVEQIQDVVEDVLIRYDYADMAKAYILYREKRREAREDRNVVIEVERTVADYLNRADWRVNANSNQGYSLGGLILNTAGSVIANYWLSHIYPKSGRKIVRKSVYSVSPSLVSGTVLYCVTPEYSIVSEMKPSVSTKSMRNNLVSHLRHASHV